MKKFFFIAITLLTTSCMTGSAYVPIVDGPEDYQYQKDLYECQRLSEKREYINGDTAFDAGAGGVAGAVLGAGSGIHSSIGGAIVGSVVGSGASIYNAKEEKKQIIVNCLIGRGHNVIG